MYNAPLRDTFNRIEAINKIMRTNRVHFVFAMQIVFVESNEIARPICRNMIYVVCR